MLVTHLLFRVRKQFPDVLLTLTDKLVEDLGTIDDLWLASVEHFANLSRHKRLSGTGRTEEQDTWYQRQLAIRAYP